MFAEIARVVAGEEDGFSAAQEWHAHQVHTGRVDDAAVVTDQGPLRRPLFSRFVNAP